MREYFMQTDRIGFSLWNKEDNSLAEMLWGEPEVTRYICASGKFTKEEIQRRLEKEMRQQKEYGVQYWPVFDLADQELIGCCGLRPYLDETGDDVLVYEIGFHLRKEYWGLGYASEAARAAIAYAFRRQKADQIFAGHHPENEASGRLLKRLGFSYAGMNYYEPTGLYHPSYELTFDQWREML